MAQPNYTPIQLYYSDTLGAAPSNANLLFGELAINIRDGKLYYKDNSGTVQVIATKGAGTIGGSTTQIQYNNAGALAGSSDMTYTSATNTVLLTKLNLTNALGATYGGTGLASYTVGDLLYADTTTSLAKLALGTANYILTVNSAGTNVQWSAPSAISVSTATNLAGGLAGSVPYQSGASTTTFLGIGAADRVMTSSGSAPQWVTALTGLTGVSSSSITNTGLTSGRVVYSSTGGLQTNSANLTFDGTTLTTAGLSNSGTSALVKLVTVGGTSFSGTTVFAPSTPAKLYMGTGTVTDATSAIGATNAVGAVASLAITPIAATNTSVTYTNAATLYIDGAPSNGTNISITNPYALYIAAGNVYLGGGTASGVAYLNTNKVLTTGSALTFDGATLVNSTNSNAGNYIVNRNVSTGTTATAYVISDATAAFAGYTAMGSRSSGYTTSGMLEASSGGLFSVGLSNGLNIMTLDGYPVKFGVSNAEGMRLTSTSLYTASTINVGIGTSSPGAKLEVNQAATAFPGFKITGSNSPGMQIVEATGVTAHFVNDSAGVYVGSSTSYPLILRTNNTEAARITSAGVFQAGTIQASGTAVGSFSASKWFIQSEDSTTTRAYYTGPDASTKGVWEIYAATSTGSAVLAGRFNASANFVAQNIGLGATIPTTSGTGITFPATQSASTNANTLDDYEEGAIDGNNLGLAYATPGTSSFTYSDRVGTYTKIGRVVYFTIDIRLSAFSKGTASGELFIVGLPFAQRVTSGFDGARCTVQLYNWTYTTSPIIAVVTSNSTTISISRMVSNSVSAVIDDPNGNSIIWVTGFYFV